MKAPLTNELTLSQYERRFETLRTLRDLSRVRDGWIKYMRSALGLTLGDLAKRLSLSRISVVQAERREMDGKVTLSTLKKMAEAMECEFVYSFVPKKELKALIHDQAIAKATKILETADLHMKLESQKVESDRTERIERLAQALIEKGDIW